MMTATASNVKDDYIRVRTNSELKKKATDIIEAMQLDMSTVINMTLDQIVRHNGLPFEITNNDSYDQQMEQLEFLVAERMEAYEAGKHMSSAEMRAKFLKEH
jgi:DNA-damage-inducible protein J